MPRRRRLSVPALTNPCWYTFDGAFYGSAPADDPPPITKDYVALDLDPGTLDNTNVPEPDAGADHGKFFLPQPNPGPGGTAAEVKACVDYTAAFLRDLLLRQNILWVQIIQYWRIYAADEPSFPGDFFGSWTDPLAPGQLDDLWTEYKGNVQKLRKFRFVDSESGTPKPKGFSSLPWPLVDPFNGAYGPRHLSTKNRRLWGASRGYTFRIAFAQRVLHGRVKFYCDTQQINAKPQYSSWGFITNFSVEVWTNPSSSSYISATSVGGF